MTLRIMFLTLLAFYAIPYSQARTRVLERVKPYAPFKIYQQYPGENICWALAAKAILQAQQGQSESPCRIVSRTRGEACCASQGALSDACNQAGHVSRALAAYGTSSTRWDVDFDRVFETLKEKGLVAIIMDMDDSSFGKRRGHVAVIYGAEKLSNGHYQFYVGDSVHSWYDFNTKDLKKLPNGRWRYLSLDVSFEWEAMIVIPKI